MPPGTNRYFLFIPRTKVHSWEQKTLNASHCLSTENCLMWGQALSPWSLHRDKRAGELTRDIPSYPVVLSGELGGRGPSIPIPRREKAQRISGDSMGMNTRKGDWHFISLDVCLGREPQLQMEGTQGRDSPEGQPAGGTDNPLTSPTPINLESRSCFGSLNSAGGHRR